MFYPGKTRQIIESIYCIIRKFYDEFAFVEIVSKNPNKGILSDIF
jgi:hypothetical protein